MYTVYSWCGNGGEQTEQKTAVPKIKLESLSFPLQGKTALSYVPLKPMMHFCFPCTQTTPLLKPITLPPPSPKHYIFPSQKPHLLLNALLNQFPKLSSLEPDPESPSPLPESPNLKVRLISLAPPSSQLANSLGTQHLRILLTSQFHLFMCLFSISTTALVDLHQYCPK